MASISSVVIGIVCIVIGIINSRGNISTLHSYHRKRVSEEDRIPFGRLVGLGTIIIGIALIFMGAMSYMATAFHQNAYQIIGSVVLAVGFIVGAGITFYAMIKYNKGIF